MNRDGRRAPEKRGTEIRGPAGSGPAWRPPGGTAPAVERRADLAERADQRRVRVQDARFPTLSEVVSHYDTTRALGLSEEQKKDLVEYLKSL
jgi:hypothetical protein